MSDELRRDLDEGTVRINQVTGRPYDTTSWSAIDLEPFIRGEQVVAPPLYLVRTDGRALIYPGKPHVFFGESESLKSWAALLACRSVLEAGKTAVYIDMEGSEPAFVERSRMVGVADVDLVTQRLKFIRPTGPLNTDAAADLYQYEVSASDPALIVLDGVTELYSLQGWNINDATDAAKFQQLFGFRGICASIAIDHTAKEAGHGSLGSQHKRAGLDGAEYEFRPGKKGGRGRRSDSEIRVTKDRHGFVREWADDVVGQIVVDGTVRLEAPTLSDLVDGRAEQRVSETVIKIVARLKRSGGDRKSDLPGLVGRRRQDVLIAIDQLESEDRVRQEVREHGAVWVVPEQPPA